MTSVHSSTFTKLKNIFTQI